MIVIFFEIIYVFKVNTPLETAKISENNYPYIVAFGTTPTNNVRYYLAVETHLIPVMFIQNILK